MKPLKLLVMVVPVLFLQACATVTPPPPLEAVLSLSGKTCVSEPSLKNAVSLMPVKKLAYNMVFTPVDEKTPCLTLNDVSGNYVVYALPEHGENHTLTVGGVQEVLRTFIPSVRLLDANGKVTRAFAQDRLVTMGNMIGVQFRPMPNERYILVQSDAALTGKSVNEFATRINVNNGYAINPVTGYGASYQTQHGYEGSHTRVYSHEGSINVTVQSITGKIGLPNEK